MVCWYIQLFNIKFLSLLCYIGLKKKSDSEELNPKQSEESSSSPKDPPGVMPIFVGSISSKPVAIE